MTYTICIWKSWVSLRSHLILSMTGNVLPTDWRIKNILNLLHLSANMVDDIQCNIIITMGKLDITKVQHQWDSSTNT